MNKMLTMAFVMLFAIPDPIWWPMWGLVVGFGVGWNLRDMRSPHHD